MALKRSVHPLSGRWIPFCLSYNNNKNGICLLVYPLVVETPPTCVRHLSRGQIKIVSRERVCLFRKGRRADEGQI